MKIGWVAKAENKTTQERVHTVYACSKHRANHQLNAKSVVAPITVELVSPYTEVDLSTREQKTFKGDLPVVMKELVDLNPLLLSNNGNEFIIEVDKLS